jgi:Phage gp6-like head-tail connector protein
MTIQFIKNYVTADGVQHREGEVASVSPSVGYSLIAAGVARLRAAPAPQERKADPRDLPTDPLPPILPNVQIPTQELKDLGAPSVPVALEDRDNFIRNLGTILTGGPSSYDGSDGTGTPPVTPSGSASAREPVLTLPEIKAQCHIELDQTYDDTYLMQLEMGARLHTENYLRYTIDATVGENIKQALLILIADWYRNRELMRDGRWVDAPVAYKALLSVERDYPTYS